MIQRSTPERPIRVGIFTAVEQAANAVRALQAAGFTNKHITVICSDETKEQYFRAFEHQEPAGAHTPAAAALGSTIGAVLMGAGVTAGVVATGGLALPLFVIGPLAAGAGGVLGGLVGAMMTRGIEKELANFYDQAIREGKILVAAEDTEPNSGERLATAEEILADAGADPVRLPEG